LLPLRSGWIPTVIRSPGLSDDLRHPRRSKCVGAAISRLHSSSWPWGFLTVSWM